MKKIITTTLPKSMDTSHLKAKATSGTRWYMGSQVFQRSLDFLISLILARLLLPNDFGLVGIATVFIGFIRTIVIESVEPSIYANPNLQHQDLSSMFWLMTFVGLVMTLLSWGVAPLISQIYENPDLLNIIRVLSVTLLMVAISIVPNAVIRKRLHFKMNAILNIISGTTAVVISLALVWGGWGYWGLVANPVIKSLLTMILPLIFWRPDLGFNRSRIQSTITASMHLMGFNFFNYLGRNIDDMLVGKYLGLHKLGFYQKAYFLMTLPITQINGVLANVMQPTLALLAQDPIRLKGAYLKVIRMLAYCGLPALTGLFVTAEDLIPTLWGPQWVDTIKPFKILCLAGILQTVNHPVGWLYIALGRTRRMFIWGTLVNIGIIVTFIYSICWNSLEMLCLIYLMINLVLFLPTHFFSCRLISVNLTEFLKNIFPVFLTSLLMGIGVYIIKRLIGSAIDSLFLRSAIEVISGILFYFILSYFLQRQEFLEIKSILTRTN